MDKETGYAEAMADETVFALMEREDEAFQLWDALAVFIRHEAKYAAREMVNQNTGSDRLNRDKIESAAREAFLRAML